MRRHLEASAASFRRHPGILVIVVEAGGSRHCRPTMDHEELVELDAEDGGAGRAPGCEEPARAAGGVEDGEPLRSALGQHGTEELREEVREPGGGEVLGVLGAAEEPERQGVVRLAARVRGAVERGGFGHGWCSFLGRGTTVTRDEAAGGEERPASRTIEMEPRRFRSGLRDAEHRHPEGTSTFL